VLYPVFEVVAFIVVPFTQAFPEAFKVTTVAVAQLSDWE